MSDDRAGAAVIATGGVANGPNRVAAASYRLNPYAETRSEGI